MKRAGWLAWNVLAALSLFLVLATIGLWVRSYWIRDTIGFGFGWDDSNYHVTQSVQGGLHFLTLGCGDYAGRMRAYYTSARLTPGAAWNGGFYAYPAEDRWWLGFAWHTSDRSSLGPSFPPKRLIAVPHWSLAVVFTLVPLACAAGVRRRVGLLDLLFIVAAIALALAIPIGLVRSMNQGQGGLR
ncbi:MAG: hypothetical protein U0800_19655 [Isosphaeraceae bacterium]